MSAENFVHTNIKTGTKESEVLKWALETAHDFWCTEEEAKIRDGKIYDEIYTTKNGDYYIKDKKEIIEDIIYRLEEVFPYTAEAASRHENTRSMISASERATQKLKELL